MERRKPAIDETTVNDALAFMMSMDAKLDELLAILRDEDNDGSES